LPHLLTRPLEFMASVRDLGELAWIYLGPQPVLAVNSPAQVHRMLVTEGRKYDQGKYFDKIRDTFGNGLPVSNGAFHQRQRRLIQPAFHRERIERYSEVMLDASNAMASSWRSGQTVQMKQECMQLMLTMVARTLFSAEVGAGVHAEVQRSWATVIKGITWRTMAPDFVEKLPTPGNRRYALATSRMRKAVTEAVLAGRGDERDDGSLLSMLLSARDDNGQGMTDEQVVAEIFLMLFAGTETAAFMMVWLFYELSRNPEMERLLHEEIDGVITDRKIAFDDLAKLPYTRRLLNECLRRYHPGWSFMRRANETVELAGRQFPAGTEMMFSLNALHRDPVLYSDPMRFDPDRWLPGAMDLPDGAFIPFIEGRRQCIGDSYAWVEMIGTVAAIASRWRVRPVPGVKVRELPRALMAPSEIPMVVTARS
jgi:cytochrome P450